MTFSTIGSAALIPKISKSISSRGGVFNPARKKKKTAQSSAKMSRRGALYFSRKNVTGRLPSACKPTRPDRLKQSVHARLLSADVSDCLRVLLRVCPFCIHGCDYLSVVTAPCLSAHLQFHGRVSVYLALRRLRAKEQIGLRSELWTSRVHAGWRPSNF